MNLWWILAVAVLVAAEKLGPAGERLSQWAGVALVFGGGLLGLHAATLI
jgi:predicted metal-binding membrane protein